MEKTIKFKKKLIFKRILFLIMLAVTFYIIFNFSAQEGEISSSLSQKVTEFIVKIISKIKTMDDSLKLHYIEKLHPIIRKLAHFGIYTIVGFSVMGFMCTFNIRNIIKVIISFFIGVLYAIGDEIHQYFIPRKKCKNIRCMHRFTRSSNRNIYINSFNYICRKYYKLAEKIELVNYTKY